MFYLFAPILHVLDYSYYYSRSTKIRRHRPLLTKYLWGDPVLVIVALSPTVQLNILTALLTQHPSYVTMDEEVLQLLEITLTCNEFEFNGKLFLQVCGCAMERKYSPSYADIQYILQNENSQHLLNVRIYLCCISGTWMTYLASDSSQLNLLKNSWLC